MGTIVHARGRSWPSSRHHPNSAEGIDYAAKHRCVVGSPPLSLVSRVSPDAVPAPWASVGVCVVGGILVWHGVGGAQQHALSPGDLRIGWHTAQVSAEVPRIQGY